MHILPKALVFGGRSQATISRLGSGSGPPTRTRRSPRQIPRQRNCICASTSRTTGLFVLIAAREGRPPCDLCRSDELQRSQPRENQSACGDKSFKAARTNRLSFAQRQNWKTYDPRETDSLSYVGGPGDWTPANAGFAVSNINLCATRRAMTSRARASLPRRSTRRSAAASPGLTAELATGTTGYVFVQLPVYQRVNGLQLEPKWLLSVGVRWKL